jgi:hypothetical protein
MTFDEIGSKWELRPIRNCPGRFVIRTSMAALSPQDLLGPDVRVDTFPMTTARDTVLVARLEDGGLISYRRADGTHLHTLNTPEGFARKLLDLGIELAEEKRFG